MSVHPGNRLAPFLDIIRSRLPEIEKKLESLEQRLASGLGAYLLFTISTGSLVVSLLAILLQGVRPNSGVYFAFWAVVLALVGVIGGLIKSGGHEDGEGKVIVVIGLTGLTLGASILVGAWLVAKTSGFIDANAVELFGAAYCMMTKRVLALLPPAFSVLVAVIVARRASEQVTYGHENWLWEASEMGRRALKALVHKDAGEKKSFDVRIAPGAVILGEDRFLHTLVVGTTGTGKTSRVLKPMIEQDLVRIKKGERIGITVVEPKGDFSADVADMARSLGIPVTFINPEDPDTPQFNPLEGDALTVAEIMRTVLQSLFGKQEAFFRQVQEVMARNTVLLLKAAYGDNLDIKMMTEVLRDESQLLNCLQAVERKEGGPTSLTQYFRQEVLGKNKEEMFRHALGLRLQLEDITGNALLNRVLVGKSDVNLDRHLGGGGVMVVNTAMGRLGKLGDVFGQFIIMHFQSAVFRRPGNERTRPYHVLYVDEFPRYVNPDFERLLAIGRSFRCATVLALQTTAQLLLESKPAFRDIVLENCRNKIVLNLGSAEDAKRLAMEFGERQVIQKSRTYKQEGPVALHLYPDSIREDEKFEPRFRYTNLMELKPFHAVVRLVTNGQPLPPKMVKLQLSEWDKRKAGIKSRIYDSIQEQDREVPQHQESTKTPKENDKNPEASQREAVPEAIISGAVLKLLEELPEAKRARLLRNILRMHEGEGTNTQNGDRVEKNGSTMEDAVDGVSGKESEESLEMETGEGEDVGEATGGRREGEQRFFPI